MAEIKTLNEVRREIHLADGVLRFRLHLAGNYLSKKHRYGDLVGLPAVARFLQERDGIPMYVSLAMSTELLWMQVDGELTTKQQSTEVNDLDEATRSLFNTMAESAALLEQFGDDLGANEHLGVDGLEAIRLYVARKYGLELLKLESLEPNELRKYVAVEMQGWTTGTTSSQINQQRNRR